MPLAATIAMTSLTGNTRTGTCTATGGTAPYTYQWYRDIIPFNASNLPDTSTYSRQKLRTQTAATLSDIVGGLAPTWAGSTSYIVGQLVTHSGTTYCCIIANSDASWTVGHWQACAAPPTCNTVYYYCCVVTDSASATVNAYSLGCGAIHYTSVSSSSIAASVDAATGGSGTYSAYQWQKASNVSQAIQAGVVAGGSNYTIGDILTLVDSNASTNPTFEVLCVDSNGAVLVVGIVSNGVFTAAPTTGASTTGGTGTSCTLTAVVCNVAGSFSNIGSPGTTLTDNTGWASGTRLYYRVLVTDSAGGTMYSLVAPIRAQTWTDLNSSLTWTAGVPNGLSAGNYLGSANLSVTGAMAILSSNTEVNLNGYTLTYNGNPGDGIYGFDSNWNAVNVAIRNGTIVQGQSNGYASHSIYGRQGNSWEVDHIVFYQSGDESACVNQNGSSISSVNFNIHDCIMRKNCYKRALYASAAAIANGGSGFAIGDTVTLNGTSTGFPTTAFSMGGNNYSPTCLQGTVVKVTNVSGGVITGVSIIACGSYLYIDPSGNWYGYGNPATPSSTLTQAATSGGGSGAQITLTWAGTPVPTHFADTYFASISGTGGNVAIWNNTAEGKGYQGFGIGYSPPGFTSAPYIGNNTIKLASPVRDAYGVAIGSPTNSTIGFDVSNNTIMPLSGRGIVVEGNVDANSAGPAYGGIHDNYIEVRESRDAGEYLSYGVALGIQSRFGPHNVNIFNNTILSHGGSAAAPTWFSTSLGTDCIAYGVKVIPGTYAVSNQVFNNVLVLDTTDGTLPAACLFAAGTNDYTNVFRNNIVVSNSRLIEANASDGAGCNWTFKTNTFVKAANPQSFLSINAGYWTSSATGNILLDNTWLNGSSGDDLGMASSGGGNYDFTTEWYLKVTVQNALGNPISGATVSAVATGGGSDTQTATTNASGQATLSLKQFKRYGVTYPSTSNYTYYTPYTITISATTYNNATDTITATSTQSKTYTLTGGTAPPATAYTLTGPTSGNLNQASTNFTVTPNAGYPGTITPHSSGSGTFNPTSLTWAGTSQGQTFSYTPTSTSGSPHSISTTSSPGLTDPSPISYSVIAALVAGTVNAVAGQNLTAAISISGTTGGTGPYDNQLQRSTDNVNWTNIQGLTYLLLWSDSGLLAGTTYYYRVYVLDDNGFPATSNSASITTPSSAPSAPGLLSTVNKRRSLVNMNFFGRLLPQGGTTWNEAWREHVAGFYAYGFARPPLSATNPGFYSITNTSLYVIERAAGGVGGVTYSWDRAPDNSGSPGSWTNGVSTSNPFYDTGLTHNNKYWYRCTATDSLTSSTSNAVSIIVDPSSNPVSSSGVGLGLAMALGFD